VIAFSTEIDGEEDIVVALEVRNTEKKICDEIIAAVRRAIADEHQVVPHAIVLLMKKTIPKTSSGKLQRKKCKLLYENKDLKPVGRWNRKPLD